MLLTSKIWLALEKSLWYSASATRLVGFANMIDMKSIPLPFFDVYAETTNTEIHFGVKIT